MSFAAAVIFDMDGVLVDSADAHRRAWQALGREIGTPFPDALFDRTFGQRNASVIPAWLGPTPAQRVQELGDRKESLYRDCVRDGAVRVYGGVIELVAELSRRAVGTAIASSGPAENVALLIDVIGVADAVHAVVAAEDVLEGKPHPESFLKAAEGLAVPPRRCAVIEDSVHGIEAAKRAGMMAVAVLTSTRRERLLDAGADHVLREVGDIDVTWLLQALAASTP